MRAISCFKEILLTFRIFIQCCGCYGPVGGKKDYCSKECKPINGGTVSKNTYTWFWVRSALPKRVWDKCMEYKITKANGDVVWNKLVGGNVNPKEVSYTLG